MSGTFGAFETGRSALNAFRLGMQTTGHNIANMNTEGYSRQRVNFATVKPEDIPNVGQLGQGMYASSIERIRDEFLDFQYRDNQAALGYWEKINDLYDSIQNYIPEPSASGIRDSMDTFFINLQALQESPEDTSARRSLVESANALGGMLNGLIQNFNSYNESINLELQQSVKEANQMLHDIAALNKEIYEAETLGQNANDLRDQRDVIIDKLSKMMDISYNEPLTRDGIRGEFFLSVNGRVLVQGTNVRELKAHAFMWDNHVYYDVQVAENEFDIVDNINVAEALATGSEGTYLLSVDRVANGVEWTMGGGNAHCLDTYAVKTSEFLDGKILDINTSEDKPYKLSFRTLDDDGNPSLLTIKIDKSDSGGWTLRAEINGEAKKPDGTDWIASDTINETLTIGDTEYTEVLTTAELEKFIEKAASGLGVNLNVKEEDVTRDSETFYTLKFTAPTTNNEYSPVEVTDYSGIFGTLTEAKHELSSVLMRTDPHNIEDALNISGSFRIQVGT
ncbi:MAG: flagellar hook-associated protein FlgK, partial [Synergistaceae bacterium]|nr:flagellar hook-associated protein FlgK [Synergistaceae bacterium]